MEKLNKRELEFLDGLLEFAQLTGYVDFDKYDEVEYTEKELEELTAKDIQEIRSKLNN